jgi:pyruvate/2-oxoglutarate dehydrogenase complex dihydrolipoamide dehydrogenase (E3) component
MNGHYQVAVVGSGSAGKDAALLAARAGLRTVLIEAGSLGGTGFHRGVNAVRALRACATQYELLTQSNRLGLHLALIGTEWANWLGVQRRTSARLTEALSRELDRARVDVRFGRAELVDPAELLVTEAQGATERIWAEHIILATGSRPAYPGQEQARVLNTDQILKNAYRPEHLLVIGGGYVGCELAAIHRALRARVTLAEAAPGLLPGWDEEAGLHLRKGLEQDGVEVLLNERIHLPEAPGAERPHFRLSNGTVIAPDLTLVATGRLPNVEGLGLKRVGLPAEGFIAVDERMGTAVGSIFAIGDVTGLGMLDSVAAAQARVAVQSLLGVAARFDLHWLPRCLHTRPPVAAAGWTQAEAEAAGQDVEVLSHSLGLITDDDATVIEPETTKLKLVVQTGTARLMGCLAIGPRAAEIVNLASTAIRHGLTARQVADLSLVHPSASEALVRVLQERYDRVH